MVGAKIPVALTRGSLNRCLHVQYGSCLPGNYGNKTDAGIDRMRGNGGSMFHVTVFDGKDMFEYDTAVCCLQPGIHTVEARPDFIVVVKEVKRQRDAEDIVLPEG